MDDPNGFRIYLRRAPDDDKQFSAQFQSELAKMFAALRDGGVDVRPTIFTMDSVDAAGGLTGEFFILAKTLGPAAITAIAGFLAGRVGRKVRLKIGDDEAEAKTPEEIEELLAIARKYKGEDKSKEPPAGRQ